MIYALLTAVCWSFGGFSSSRLARTFGALAGNGLRLLLSTGVLLLICLLGGFSLSVPARNWFLLSGFLHLTLGDLGLYAVYRRLGPRIGVLIVASLAPGVALLGDWLWLDSTLRGFQLALIGLILLMVILAVAPKERNHLDRKELQLGIAAGVFAALMQGLSASVSGIAYSQPGPDPSAWSAAFYRVLAGAAGVGVWILLRQLFGKNPLARPRELLPHMRVAGHPLLWLGLSTLMGPVVGIMFLMKAFSTTPSGLVQAIIAVLPVFMIPVAWVFDGTVPSRRSVVCGAAAVALTAWLMMSS